MFNHRKIAELQENHKQAEEELLNLQSQLGELKFKLAEITNVINYSLKSFNLPINIDVAYEENHEKVLKILDKVIEELIAENKYVKKGSSAGINGLDTARVYPPPRYSRARKRSVWHRPYIFAQRRTAPVGFP